MSEDKWDAMARVLHIMLVSGWNVTHVARYDETGQYKTQGVRGDWSLEFQAAEGLTDEGFLTRSRYEGVLPSKGHHKTIMLAAMSNAALEVLWAENFGS